MSVTNATQWLNFFKAAGVPGGSAGMYAHLFVVNRIQLDMLTDLNKEYLREMGITLMGDIIAILRHSKHVSEQTAREKVLSSENPLPVATVVANPIARDVKTIENNKNHKSTLSTNSVLPLPKVPRRVLPEHEGKYKIKLPSGTTERSKEILAKKAMLYSDKETTVKPRVFERLSRSTHNIEFEDLTKPNKKKPLIDQKIRITGVGSKPFTASSSSSIFSRLGGKSDPDIIEVPSSDQQIKPILKKSSKSSSSGVVKSISKSSSSSQKVLLVKKVPIKLDSDNSYDSDDDMRMDTSGDKIVSFASEAEVREIAPRVVSIKGKSKNRLTTTSNIKSRMGSGMHADRIHRTAKPVKLKLSPQQNKISPNKAQAIRMKSDELLRSEKPVYSRLGTNPVGSGLSKLANRIGRVSLASSSKSANSTATGSSSPLPRKKTPSNKSGSVFERLGFAR
ncbi:uncharacterized protein C19orf47 [Eupeodes corollae]|uniref:uncharacterized protein C19orf47 n=1 Tax=Eupeodes corollae TaxID=290404 RepID=UPI0024908C70|nr:uncharacterized protein C19orf47 [Eupeodes corollae]